MKSIALRYKQLSAEILTLDLQLERNLQRRRSR
jgi:hypothetical protein